MKKILGGAVSLIWLLVATTWAEIEQGQVDIELVVPHIIQLEILTLSTKIMPGPEDYARDLHDNEFEGGNKNTNPDTGKGFAERGGAIELTIFTNAQDGASLYVHGIQPPGPEGILKLDDTYLSVQAAKTYILQNNLEGASTKYKAEANSSYWLRLGNDSQEIFRVGVSTKDPRLVVFSLGLGNLARYTYGSYKNTIVFSLMPVVI